MLDGQPEFSIQIFLWREHCESALQTIFLQSSKPTELFVFDHVTFDGNEVVFISARLRCLEIGKERLH